MIWEKPEVVEIKMDAEIGSYQLDDEPHPAFSNGAPIGAAESRDSND